MISSEACAQNKKEYAVLFGGDNDVFKPKSTRLEPYTLLKQMAD